MTEREELKLCKCSDPDAIHEKDYCGFKMIECDTCQIAVFGNTWNGAYTRWNRRMEQEG